MRKLLLFAISLLVIHVASGQVFDHAAKALNSGNAKELSSYFASSIDISLNGTEGAYSADQAQKILADFFSKNPVSGFVTSHKGNSGSGSSYAIGTLKSSNGTTYRVTIYVKADKINELKIEQA
jgi:hypothetical protein